MNVKALISEFIGTFALTFVGISAITATAGGNLVAIALAHGLTIAVMIAAVGGISGGHLNPAVTLGALAGGRISAVGAIGYIISQCLGAVVAAMLVKGAFAAAALEAVSLGTPLLAESVTITQGLILETVATFFLVFVVYGAALDKRGAQPAALFIGLTVTLGILAIGPMTGGALNPARHLGSALVGGYTANLWLYWVAPGAGGILAGLVYHHLLSERGRAA